MITLLKVLIEGRKIGIVTVGSTKSQAGKIFLRDGNIVHATINTSPTFLPRKALFRILSWDFKERDFSHTACPHTYDELTESSDNLLRDAEQQQEQLKLLFGRRDLTGESKLKINIPFPRQLADLLPVEAAVVRAVHDTQTVQGVLDIPTISDTQACRVLINLMSLGYITKSDRNAPLESPLNAHELWTLTRITR